ncbi:ubiquitin hydrolase [Trypanosoma grayi]|uniref:ubiquitin hydrolase n=1 Tax=Trypanosoma grayi TaxID=71804 RepID=UPI0004F4ABC4|nr:ubiquitin hydrolase [Trypanosoma grayi]KEG10535.1 ubiquitin hydrolase [Trypanosoma grayi]
MSCFQLDCECTFSEYVRTIFHHAEDFVLPKRSYTQHFNVCKQVFETAVEERKKGYIDHAFYHFVRCISIIDKAGVRDEIPRAKDLMKECLDAVEKLQDEELFEHYNNLIKEVRQREGERKRIVAQQLLLDDDDDTISPEEQHTKRQQTVLLKGEEKLADALNRLKDLKIPVAPSSVPQNVVPYWSDAQNGLLHTSNDQVVLPRGMQKVSPNAYLEWDFNNGSARGSYPRRGIVNLGNTCYLNSVTQMLYATPLRKYFLCDDYTKDIVQSSKGRGRLVNSFSYILRELTRTDLANPVSPSFFKAAAGELCEAFAGRSQQDANEFLRVVLDGIHNNLNDKGNFNEIAQEIDTTKGSDHVIAEQYWSEYKKRNNSVIVDMCVFQERSSIVCPLCKQISRSFAPLLGIEVPVPSIEGKITIEDCLNAYCKEEVLDLDSLYSCPSCSRKVNASKQLLVYSLPNILLLTIKRFRFHGDFSNKIADSIIFQKQLDMSPFMCSTEKNSVYNLVGVVNHQGNIHGGHYTADCIGTDGVWFSFSDERVSEAETPNYQLAYILCYVRND